MKMIPKIHRIQWILTIFPASFKNWTLFFELAVLSIPSSCSAARRRSSKYRLSGKTSLTQAANNEKPAPVQKRIRHPLANETL